MVGREAWDEFARLQDDVSNDRNVSILEMASYGHWPGEDE